MGWREETGSRDNKEKIAQNENEREKETVNAGGLKMVVKPAQAGWGGESGGLGWTVESGRLEWTEKSGGLEWAGESGGLEWAAESGGLGWTGDSGGLGCTGGSGGLGWTGGNGGSGWIDQVGRTGWSDKLTGSGLEEVPILMRHEGMEAGGTELRSIGRKSYIQTSNPPVLIDRPTDSFVNRCSLVGHVGGSNKVNYLQDNIKLRNSTNIPPPIIVLFGVAARNK